MVYVSKGTAGKSTAAPAENNGSGSKGGGRGRCAYTLKFLPSGAIEGEDGRLPWVALACIWEQENTSDKDGSKYFAYSGDSFPRENDPDRLELTRYKLKVVDGETVLEIVEGKRVKKAGAKSADGRQFVQTGDSKIVKLSPVLNKEGQPVKRNFIGEDDDHNTYRLFEYRSKEDWARWEADKDKPKVSRAQAAFG